MINGGTSSIARGVRKGRMLSYVRSYRCGLIGHLQYTCTTPTKRAAAGVEYGLGILPLPAHMNVNENGKHPAAEIPQEAKKHAVGDGAKYRKPY